MASHFERSGVELALISALRPTLEVEIKRLGYIKAAHRLELASMGVKSLIWHNTWSIERSLRVLEMIGLPVKTTLRDAIETI